MVNTDVEAQWLMFKDKMYPSGRMHPEQEFQLRNTFYAAFGQALLLVREISATVTEDEAVEAFKNIQGQVMTHFQKFDGSLN